jgi:hypothetical protein
VSVAALFLHLNNHTGIDMQKQLWLLGLSLTLLAGTASAVNKKSSAKTSINEVQQKVSQTLRTDLIAQVNKFDTYCTDHKKATDSMIKITAAHATQLKEMLEASKTFQEKTNQTLNEHSVKLDEMLKDAEFKTFEASYTKNFTDNQNRWNRQEENNATFATKYYITKLKAEIATTLDNENFVTNEHLSQKYATKNALTEVNTELNKQSSIITKHTLRLLTFTGNDSPFTTKANVEQLKTKLDKLETRITDNSDGRKQSIINQAAANESMTTNAQAITAIYDHLKKYSDTAVENQSAIKLLQESLITSINNQQDKSKKLNKLIKQVEAQNRSFFARFTNSTIWTAIGRLFRITKKHPKVKKTDQTK